ncbi:LysR family transcriptional regulator [Kribbella jejuensis]|uniref:DNA-binding transcriptional LysR family regulator n=1 Tax=Kribbella jejuensis TaxID=236068 RepID=A0A542E908_9ACTN|nr:LysR family transcriptional regulator [Kribbella jejuensis]TQJ11808.1 DNA-binding transcriptional LysR family regulator [Kribbella jejuensis]
MDPHLLRTFVAVAECGSFSAAATQLGYTQSAVSHHIAALETDLGTPLLHRRPVTPTPAGERLLEHAGPLLLRLDAARADVRRTVTAAPTTLALAASPLAAPSLVGLLAELRRTYPGTEISLTICSRAQVVAGVAAGTFTLATTDGIAAPSDPLRLSDTIHLRTTPLTHEALVVALPKHHPLARPTTPHPPNTLPDPRSGLSLGDLVDARWIDAPALAAPLPALRAAAGSDAIRPAFTYTGTDLRTLHTLIAAGHGLAVLPRSAVPQELAAIPLTSPHLVHRIELLHGHLSDPAAKALAAALSNDQ